jgi:hypothetical protein
VPFSYPGELILSMCTQIFYYVIKNHKICRVQCNNYPFMCFTFTRNVISVHSSIFLIPSIPVILCTNVGSVETVWQLNACWMIQGLIPTGGKKFFSLPQPV